MVFGGIIVSDAMLTRFHQKMQEWRGRERMTAELKWNKVSAQKYSEYVSLVDLFFHQATQRLLLFKSVVFDTYEIDYKTYHEGDHEIGFYKFFYQFILHKFGRHAAKGHRRLIIHFDERKTHYSLEKFRVILNRGMRKKYNLNEDVVRAVQVVRSHDSDVIQIADVLMGAVGFQWNGLHLLPESRRAKIDLAAHIAQKAGLSSLAKQTPWGADQFEIWQFRFSKKRQSAPTS